jgi:hypothetical protein
MTLVPGVHRATRPVSLQRVAAEQARMVRIVVLLDFDCVEREDYAL